MALGQRIQARKRYQVRQHEDTGRRSSDGISPAHKLGRIRTVKKDLLSRAESCELCPRHCGINRLAGERGYCRAPKGIMTASHCLHYGEEPPISGSRGSGTIFFSHCNLRCVFCQNYQISHDGLGRLSTPLELAAQMLELQNKGAHNINLVAPTPYSPWLMEALEIAIEQGLSLPLVYNTHSYESRSVIGSLNGIIDIYLPDLKYSQPSSAIRFSDAPDYPEVAREAITNMVNQAGPLTLDEQGTARRGVLVRHLVLPGHREDSFAVIDFMAGLDKSIPVALMSQYYPSHRAAGYPPLDRRLKNDEYQGVVRYAIDLGLEEILVQEPESAENYRPDFEHHHPFDIP